jgi:hypothetical protein
MLITPEDIAAHNLALLRQRGRLKIYAAAEATVVVGNSAGWHQLCLMGFAADGSFYVTWPYLNVSDGIVAEITFPEVERPGPVNVSLAEHGRFTSQRVKYSHHRSGFAQFSLSGRVRNDIRRFAFPLTGPIGHLFHLQCHFPRAFKTLERLKSRRLYLTFLVPAEPEEFLVKGEWHRKTDIFPNIVGRGNVGPVNTYKNRRTGERGLMTFWSPPLHSPVATHFVGIIGTQVPPVKGASEPGLVLIGGFDRHEVDPQIAPAPKIRAGLAAMYPTRSPDELRRKLGSIDIEGPLAG